MKKSLILTISASILLTGCTQDIKMGFVNHPEKKFYKLVEYTPLTQSECFQHSDSLGLKYCPYDNDHLAGAAMACKHINNLPSKQDLQMLAREVYGKQTEESTIYGIRNDKLLKRLGIFVNDSHIYYWVGEEANDGEGGYVRMFASKGSIPYYAPRDGGGYVSKALGKINYGNTKNIKTGSDQTIVVSNPVEMSNNDELVTICYQDKKEINFNFLGKILNLH